MTVEEKTIESELLLKGNVFNVRRHKVIAKGGKIATRDIVEHSGGVAICALTEENKLLMIRQFRKAAESVVWEIPAGKSELGETSLSTAIRELQEETGYSAEHFEPLVQFYGTIGYNNEIIEIFKARATEKGETAFDEHEAIELYEMELPQLLDMIDTGEIIDAKTIVGILLVARQMGIA